MKIIERQVALNLRRIQRSQEAKERGEPQLPVPEHVAPLFIEDLIIRPLQPVLPRIPRIVTITDRDYQEWLNA